MSSLTEETNDTFSDLRALKTLFAFFENLFLLHKMKNGCPVSRKIVVDSAAIEL